MRGQSFAKLRKKNVSILLGKKRGALKVGNKLYSPGWSPLSDNAVQVSKNGIRKALMSYERLEIIEMVIDFIINAEEV